MNFIDAVKKEMLEVSTENGDMAFSTSGSYCLDYFSLIGGLRCNYKEIVKLFLKAFHEDEKMAIKLLFFTRDIKQGLGERNSFKMIFAYLAVVYPNIAKKLIEYIPTYGRYDDLLVGLFTPIENDILIIIKNQLDQDLINKKDGKNISLLAKWLPSINTSNDLARKQACHLVSLLGWKKEEYRKTLSYLRKGLIIENNLREMQYDFDYSIQPSQAMFKYTKAFYRNDNERYSDYLDNVRNNKVKLNTGTLFPYQIVNRIEKRALEYETTNLTDEEINALDVTWNSIERDAIDSKTIIVRDGSGSMYSEYAENSANSIATSLSILFSEQLKEPFKNHFITFSENPKLIEIKGKNIVEKVLNVFREDEVANTNIWKVYKLIYKIASSNHVKKEDMIERIVIISDMEFDECVEGETTFAQFKDLYEKSGYDFPKLVFWNVEARNIHLPVRMNEKNVHLVSGSSKNVIKMITDNESINPYEFMVETLEKYDNIIKKIFE